MWSKNQLILFTHACSDFLYALNIGWNHSLPKLQYAVPYQIIQWNETSPTTQTTFYIFSLLYIQIKYVLSYI